MQNRGLHHLIAVIVDTCLGWGQSKVVEASPITRQMKERLQGLGPHGIVLSVSRVGFGPAYQKVQIRHHVVLDSRTARDDLAKSVIEECWPMIHNQMLLRAQAVCSGIQQPLEREEFIDLRRLQIDIAAARALQDEFGSDNEVCHWLRDQLGKAFDRLPASKFSKFFVSGLTVEVPFKLDPLQLDVNDKIRSDDDHWCGSAVNVSFHSEVGRDEATQRIFEILSDTPLAGRHISTLETWPPHEFVVASKRRRGLGNADQILPAEKSFQWQANVSEKLASIDQLFC